MISIDKYPKSASAELEPEEIQNRIKARDLQLSLKDPQHIYIYVGTVFHDQASV